MAVLVCGSTRLAFVAAAALLSAAAGAPVFACGGHGLTACGRRMGLRLVALGAVVDVGGLCGRCVEFEPDCGLAVFLDAGCDVVEDDLRVASVPLATVDPERLERPVDVAFVGS